MNRQALWSLGILLLLTTVLLSFSYAGAQPLGHPLTQPPDSPAGGASHVWTMPRWSPYAAGVGIGILTWLAFLLANRPLGVSTAFAQTSGMLECGLRGPKAKARPYYREVPPKVDWQWMLVVGVVVGATVSAVMSGTFALHWTPALWVEHFGHTPLARWIVAFIGGALVGVGSRWAGGCTSGHGISGTLQLVVSGWVAVLCFFVGGVATAFIIFGLFG